jgi:hypothetical protein
VLAAATLSGIEVSGVAGAAGAMQPLLQLTDADCWFEPNQHSV